MKRFLRGMYLGNFDVDPPIGKVIFYTLLIVLLVVLLILFLVNCTAM